MKRIKVVMLHEIITQVSRKSFWIITMGVPIMAALVLILVNAINRDARVSEAVAGIINNPVETRPEGFVDPGGLIKSIPEGFPQGMFQQYLDESSAVEALEVGDISAYFLLPADYIDKGKIYYIAQKFNLLESGSENSGTFNWLVDFNLLDGNGNLASLVNGP